jgi:biopolymer transport protein TolQ
LISGYLHGLLLDVNFWELVKGSGAVPLTVMGVLLMGSLNSVTIIFAKFATLGRARNGNARFLRSFRKATHMDAIAPTTSQFRNAPLATVFDFGYSEVARQLSVRGRVTNSLAVERALQLGMSEEISRLERHMNWLATTATVSPFVGLFGTVWGIIDAFQQLGLSGATSMRAVGPGIAVALYTTAAGLLAAIPAAIFYNIFGHGIKEIGARMEEFSLEFANLSERNSEQ